MLLLIALKIRALALLTDFPALFRPDPIKTLNRRTNYSSQPIRSIAKTVYLHKPLACFIGMKTKPVIKKAWTKPLVKTISVKKDTFNGTLPPKEGPVAPLSRLF